MTPPERVTPLSNRPGGALVAWALVALILVVALIQLAFNAPGGSGSATPDSVATCNFLFPHTEQPADLVAAGVVQDFRDDCERGLALPR